LGIIFCSFSEAAQEHPELVRKYLGSVVPYTDNFFATLNSAVFTDGSFCYIPKGVRCPMELSTYFRIYAERKGMISTVEGRIRNRYADRLVSPEEIHADPARFILCLSFFDIKHLIDIDPLPGGLYIYSSSEAYEEEQVIDQRRLHNWLERFGFEHVGFERRRASTPLAMRAASIFSGSCAALPPTPWSLFTRRLPSCTLSTSRRPGSRSSCRRQVCPSQYEHFQVGIPKTPS